MWCLSVPSRQAAVEGGGGGGPGKQFQVVDDEVGLFASTRHLSLQTLIHGHCLVTLLCTMNETLKWLKLPVFRMRLKIEVPLSDVVVIESVL